MKVKGHRNLVTVVGSAASVGAGEFIECAGVWVNDRQHGLQLKVSELNTVQPTRCCLSLLITKLTVPQRLAGFQTSFITYNFSFFYLPPIMHDELEKKEFYLKAGWRDMDGKGSCPHTISGNVKALYGLYAPQLLDNHDIFVYLPPSYGSSNKRYPVIYMQDGQNLFDEAISYAGEWQVDETMDQLSLEGIEAIVVGVANGRERRISEYNPFLSKHQGDADENNYLQFVINTLKPLIDQSFKTQPGRESTGILGSSMGGLISLYAFLRFPMVFGMAGALSHWMWVKGQVDPDRVCDFIVSSRYTEGRLYIDIGDREYVDYQITGSVLTQEQILSDSRRIKVLLINKGYRLGRDFLYLEVPGGSHSERDWASRLPDVLRFLLSGVSSAYS